MSTPDDLLQQAIAFFFGTALPEATGKRFADLPQPLVHVGSYTVWDGTQVTTRDGQSIAPAFALRVSPALPVTDGVASAAGVSAPTTGPARHLIRLRHLADAAVDDAAEIQRVMADLDSFVTLAGGLTDPAAGAGSSTPPTPDGQPPVAPPDGQPAPGPTTGPAAPGAAGQPAAGNAGTSAGGRAAEWAAAVVAARGALAVDLSTLTAVPAGLQQLAPDVDALRAVLQRFFTYTAEGAYYPRWSGSGRDADNPDHLTPQYRQNNVLEEQLDRDQIYLYAVLPESVLNGGAELGANVFREIVVRFTPTAVPEAPFTLATVYTVRTRPQAAPYCDFVFFRAAEGRGIPVAQNLLAKMSASLIQLIGALTGPAQVDEVLDDDPATSTPSAAGRRIHLVVTLTGEPTLPPGVVGSGDGEVRVLLAPPDQIAAVAALPEVQHLAVITPERATNDKARSTVNFAALDGRLPAGKKGGAGVLVGIIDSGIDGSHPAFAGRIHAVWDQGVPGGSGAGSDPATLHPGEVAYQLMDWGVELTGAAVANAGDPNTANPADGHGTHVAGTAAGAEVRDAGGNILAPAGLAPQSKIAVVRAIQVDGAHGGDTVLAVQWIFQKATELGLPCVINMSFGQHIHGHDGSDASSRAMLALCRDKATRQYLPGRILVAAAGNERTDKIHLRRTLPANSGNVVVGTLRFTSQRRQQVVIWVKDPTGTCPVAFPVSAYVFRRTPAGTAPTDITWAVPLGTQAVVSTRYPNAAGVFPLQLTRVSILTELSQSVNGDHSFRISFATTQPATATLPGAPMRGNDWGIVLVNRTAHALDVHLWADGGNGVFTTVTTDDDKRFLVGAPAASAGTISVAAATSRLSWKDVNGNTLTLANDTTLKEVASFSSPGPLRASSIPPDRFSPAVTHEVNAIDVAAPGAMLQSALSSQVATATWLADPKHSKNVVNNRSQVLGGTSMATPVVTGLVANMLANNAALTMPEVLAKLKAASTIPPGTTRPAPAGSGAKPLTIDWGYGLVDANGLVP